METSVNFGICYSDLMYVSALSQIESIFEFYQNLSYKLCANMK